MSSEDPKAYTILRRMQDMVGAIIAITIALIAIFKWFYQKPLDMEAKIDHLSQMMMDQKEAMEELSSQLDATNRRLTNFQESFKVGRPGHWTLQGNGWRWVEEKPKK